jgi:hypothetical protein
MKAIRLLSPAMAILLFILSSCQKNSYKEPAFSENISLSTKGNEQVLNKASASSPCNPFAYEVILESRTLTGGNWEWIWSVRNPNPGNGSNGTSKNLSHWDIQFETCFNPSALMSGAYSSDGMNWINFSPSVERDPSQSCVTTPVLKFDFGTTGTAKSYYRLVLSQEYPVGNALAYYKAGTGCCSFNFPGIVCPGQVERVE